MKLARSDLSRRMVTQALVFFAVTTAGSTALAADTGAAAPVTYGRWEERDNKLGFELRKAEKPNALTIVIPKEVSFPGSHDFLLIRRPDGSFQSAEVGRPSVALTFKSATEASLKIRGRGQTKREVWIAMSDYLLVRR